MNTCPNSVNCPVTPVLLGYSADTPDSFLFVGAGFGPLTPPPLGWAFSRATGYAPGFSTVSQAAADSIAFQQAVFGVQVDWAPPGSPFPAQWTMPADGPADWAPPLI
jgi:hypothetical protein